jgi:hypothetical protein
MHCGYVPLINDLEKNNNCLAATAVIDKRIRVIIYSRRKIKKGEQLGYAYNRLDENVYEERSDSEDFEERSDSEDFEVNISNTSKMSDVPEKKRMLRSSRTPKASDAP